MKRIENTVESSVETGHAGQAADDLDTGRGVEGAVEATGTVADDVSAADGVGGCQVKDLGVEGEQT
jgi:hypothetical protein